MDTETLERKHRSLKEHLKEEFIARARRSGIEVDPENLVGGWYGNTFVASAGSRSGVGFDQGRPLGIILLSAPNGYALETEEGVKLGSGCYEVAAFVAKEPGRGHLELTDAVQGASVEIAMAAPIGGAGRCSNSGTHECTNPTDVTITIKDCQICFSWDCDSFCHQVCLNIPFCKSRNEVIDEVVAKA